VRYRQRETAKYARGGGNSSGEGDESRDTPRRGSRFWFGDPNAADHCAATMAGDCASWGSATPRTRKIILLGYIAVSPLSLSLSLS